MGYMKSTAASLSVHIADVERRVSPCDERVRAAIVNLPPCLSVKITELCLWRSRVLLRRRIRQR